MGMVVLWIIIAIAVATTTTILLRLLGVRRGWANDVAEDDRPRAPISFATPPSGSRSSRPAVGREVWARGAPAPP